MRLSDVEILDYNPKDVIIVKVNRILSKEDTLELTYYVKSIFKTNEVLILDKDTDLYPYRDAPRPEAKKLLELEEASDRKSIMNRFWNFLLS